MLQVAPRRGREVVRALDEVAVVFATGLGGRVERDELLGVGWDSLPLAAALVEQMPWEGRVVPDLGLAEQGPAVLSPVGRVQDCGNDAPE